MSRYLIKKQDVLISILLAGALLLPSSQAYALLEAHVLVDGCSTCHTLHASPGGALFAVSSDPTLVCLSCHGPGGSSLLKADIHALKDGNIICNECHNSHNNGNGIDSEVVRENIDGTYNIKLVGLTEDYNSDPPATMVNQVREEFASGVLGVPKDVVYNSATDYDRADGKGLCNACHTSIHNTGQTCSDCHAHAGGFAGSGDCRACHDGSGIGAELISIHSPHSTNTIYNSTGVTFTCENCHTDHELGTVQIPNNTAVDIDYSTSGHDGISLGNNGGVYGSANYNAAGLTEAEICWDCHDRIDVLVSEWETNTDTNGGSFPNYDFGTLSPSNWVGTWNGTTGTTAVWSSANFSFKQGNIQSTHSVNDVDGVSGKDIVADLRCSYCHDVHDTFGPNTGSGPFLRGNWVGNPYREDGAPRNDSPSSLPGDVADYSAYNVAAKFGAVPRGGATYDALGGYFIDQNSGNPTDDVLMDSADEFAGLCVLCHAIGDTDGLWDATEIDAINEFGTPEDDWVGDNNGHAVVVKGGSGANAANLFTMSKRFPTTTWSAYTGDGSHGGNPVMAYQNAYVYNSKRSSWDRVWGQGLRGTDSTAFQYSPPVNTAGRGFNFDLGYDWGATVVIQGSGTMTDSGTDSSFHQFTCSKCHNPHASRLPRLLITNCLDTNHNTWDDSYVTPASDSNGGGDSLSPENQSVSLSQVTAAQNCHRLADPNYSQAGPQGTAAPADGGENGGWNRVSPWVEF